MNNEQIDNRLLEIFNSLLTFRFFFTIALTAAWYFLLFWLVFTFWQNLLLAFAGIGFCWIVFYVAKKIPQVRVKILITVAIIAGIWALTRNETPKITDAEAQANWAQIEANRATR